jgi:hypothetical protein
MEDDSLRILEHAGVGIAQVGLDGWFLWVNRRMTELWGYKITQPFFTTKDAGKGTGLGLSIAAGIVTSHHGTLALHETAPNTRFVVRPPSQQRSAS